jgi:hypothetical protein
MKNPNEAGLGNSKQDDKKKKDDLVDMAVKEQAARVKK